MRSSSIGRIKSIIRSISLKEARLVLDEARASGKASVREDIVNWLAKIQVPYY